MFAARADDIRPYGGAARIRRRQCETKCGLHGPPRASAPTLDAPEFAEESAGIRAFCKGRRGRRPLRSQPRRVCPDRANEFKSVFPATCAPSSDRARSARSAEASSPSSHPLPRSSSQNQSPCFDFERSGSEMSLLSRLRGSKGYGTCRDADQAGPEPRAIKASTKKRASSQAGSLF